MNLLKILGKVGGSILADVVPGGNTIISVVNEFLDDEDKLPEKATGADIQNAVLQLPADQQAQVLLKEFDVEIVEAQEHTKVIAALADVDKTGNSTRPAIAMMMAKIVCFSVITIIAVFATAIISDNVETIKAIGDNWPLVIAILGTPTALLRSYFGMRTKEKQQKYQAVSNAAPSSALTSIVELWKSK